MTKVVNKPAADLSASSTNVEKGNVQDSKTVLAENSKKAQEILAKNDKGKNKPESKKTDKKADKKEKKERAESNEHIGERLLKEKASEQKILATFVKVYKDKKGITDKKFIKARADIYIAIATKRAEAKKVVKKAA